MTPELERVNAIAAECGAVSYTPPPLRAVRGLSFSFEALGQFVALIERGAHRIPAPTAAPAPEIKMAGIAIDAWKLPVFSKRLTNAGFTYEQKPGLDPGTYILKVPAALVDLQQLAQVCLAANTEAARTRKPHGN